MMVDRVNRATRHRIMSGNRSANTSPEVEVRKALFNRGLRYRIHCRNLPGKPDIVIHKHKVAIFVHGCFWHGHDCKRRPRSKSNTTFWSTKIAGNAERDFRYRSELLAAGWRVLVVWECAVRRKKPAFRDNEDVVAVRDWVLGYGRTAVLSESGLETYS